MSEHINHGMPPVEIKFLIKHDDEWYEVIRTSWGWNDEVVLPTGKKIKVKGKAWRYP